MKISRNKRPRKKVHKSIHRYDSKTILNAFNIPIDARVIHLAFIESLYYMYNVSITKDK